MKKSRRIRHHWTLPKSTIHPHPRQTRKRSSRRLEWRRKKYGRKKQIKLKKRLCTLRWWNDMVRSNCKERPRQSQNLASKSALNRRSTGNFSNITMIGWPLNTLVGAPIRLLPSSSCSGGRGTWKQRLLGRRRPDRRNHTSACQVGRHSRGKCWRRESSPWASASHGHIFPKKPRGCGRNEVAKVRRNLMSPKRRKSMCFVLKIQSPSQPKA